MITFAISSETIMISVIEIRITSIKKSIYSSMLS